LTLTASRLQTRDVLIWETFHLNSCLSPLVVVFVVVVVVVVVVSSSFFSAKFMHVVLSCFGCAIVARGIKISPVTLLPKLDARRIITSPPIHVCTSTTASIVAFVVLQLRTGNKVHHCHLRRLVLLGCTYYLYRRRRG
jgi:hypothetical protein